MKSRRLDLNKKKILIAASVSCFNLYNIEEQLESLTCAGLDLLHFDVVDGRFNDCFILGTPTLKAVRKNTGLPIEVHLGVYEPEKYITQMVDNGADYIAVQYEVLKNADAGLEIFNCIESAGARPLLALKAATAVNKEIIELAVKADWLIKLTVDPGYSGQKIKGDAIDSIKALCDSLKQNGLEAVIEADGNINGSTIPAVVKAGATILTGGSSGLFINEEDIIYNLNNMRDIALNNI